MNESSAPGVTATSPPLRQFRRVCVYCGSNSGAHPRYAEAAADLGKRLAERKIGVVYGGGSVGLMGILADAALAAGGEVIGIIPEKLQQLEVGHTQLTERYIVDGMHPRKMMMSQLADAFIALPGGWGTLEEVFETTTWVQLNYVYKPIGLLNVGGFYDHLIRYLDHAAAEGFIRGIHRDLLRVSDDADTLLDDLARYDIPRLSSWIGPGSRPPGRP